MARALHAWRSWCTLANTKLHVPPKTASEATPTECGRLSTAFVTTPLLDSKTEHYISTVAHRASHSRQREVTERSENATSRPITHYHAYWKYTERVLPYSGPAAVVLSTVLRNCNNQLFVGASLSEPHTSESNGGFFIFFIYIYIYIYLLYVFRKCKLNSFNPKHCARRSMRAKYRKQLRKGFSYTEWPSKAPKSAQEPLFGGKVREAKPLRREKRG